MGDWLTEALIEASGIGRSYRRGDTTLPALVTANCTVLTGDRIAVVGPSGSGKSTLLHLLAGLDHPTKGKIRWPALGTAETLRPRKIAIVFQMPSLLSALTVIENVELPLLLGQGNVGAREPAMMALSRIGLAKIADKLPEELSGGQVQRVAMARALAGDPKLILADEPTGQLDRVTGMHLFDAMLTHLANTDTALLVATHDLEVAKRMDTVWYMRRGVLDAPRTEEVAG
jgi:ABC-type lipoprotein export system ATPase subunit